MIFHDCSVTGTAPGGHALDALQPGDQVMLVAYVPESILEMRYPIWVKITEVRIPPTWQPWTPGCHVYHDNLDLIRYSGVTTADGRGDEIGLPPGTPVQFLRRNITLIA